MSTSPESDYHYDVIIAGAGLSGLHSANLILKDRPETSILILESSNRIGGRIHGSVTSENTTDLTANSGPDLGGAWLWKHDADILENQFLKEYSNVDDVTETEIQLGYGSPRSAPRRVKNGLGSVINKMYRRLLNSSHGSSCKVLTNHPVVKVEQSYSNINGQSEDIIEGEPITRVTVGRPDRDSSTSGNDITKIFFTCKHLLFAMPPSIVAQSIQFDDETAQILGLRNIGKRSSSESSSSRLYEKMLDQPIWMASSGKIALFYEERFWNPNKLSGGLPMDYDGIRSSFNAFKGGFQVYDGGEISQRGSNSNTDTKQYAIVCFVAGGDQPEKVTTEEMTEIVTKQLGKMMKSDTNDNPFKSKLKHSVMKMWRTDPNITGPPLSLTESRNPNNLNRLSNFPSMPYPIVEINGMKNSNRNIWFINSEASSEETGLLGGAIRMAQFGARKVLEKLKKIK